MHNFFYKRHAIRKRFSQNFLQDSAIIDDIVAVINPEPGQAIVEIGPGLGALTKPIAKRVNRITVIEIDRDLVFRLSSDYFLRSKLDILNQDAMTLNFTVLSKEWGSPLRIVSNLPYNIATPLMFHCFKHITSIRDMHLMLQKEIVDRLLSAPNKKSYGRLSVIAQYFCQITPVLEVAPTSFWPIPKVDSVMVRFVPYSNALLTLTEKDLNSLNALTRLAFSQRRKVIRNSLSIFFSSQQLEEQGIDSTLRAENISVEHYCRLAVLLSNR